MPATRPVQLGSLPPCLPPSPPLQLGSLAGYTPKQVEEVKLVLRLLPIFAATVAYWWVGCCYCHCHLLAGLLLLLMLM